LRSFVIERKRINERGRWLLAAGLYLIFTKTKSFLSILFSYSAASSQQPAASSQQPAASSQQPQFLNSWEIIIP
jgi:hypothetical protein